MFKALIIAGEGVHDLDVQSFTFLVCMHPSVITVALVEWSERRI